MQKVIVLGAGISGLALAYFLKKKGMQVTLLEKSERAGGWIQTIEKEGFLFELGPRGFRPKGPGIETLRLIEELGLQDQVIRADPSAHVRYLYRKGKLQQVPTSLFGFFTSPVTRGLFFTLCREWFVPRVTEEDPSIYDFVSHRFNPYVAEEMMDPLVAGIYAGDIRQLSMKSCFPAIYEMEKKHGSLMWGLFSRGERQENETSFVRRMCKESVVSFKGGMQVLVDALAEDLKDHIFFNQEVRSVQRGIVETDKGVFEADTVVSTLPGKEVYRMFGTPEVDAVSVAVVNLGYRRNLKIPKGFGYLVPSGEKEEILGMVWDSSVFPQQSRDAEETRLTVMIGGAHMADFQKYKACDFLEIALRAVEKHLGITGLPDANHVKLAHEAIPQYVTGHGAKLEKTESMMPAGVGLLGSSYYGVSVNDCIAQALTFVCKKSEGQSELGQRRG